MLDDDIMDIASSYQVGPLLLLTEELKAGLMSETQLWKWSYGRALNQECGVEMDLLSDFFITMQQRLSRPMRDLDDIRDAMAALSEIRNSEIKIDRTIVPIEEAYALLAKYEMTFNDGNAERVDSLGYQWRLLQQKVDFIRVSVLYICQ